PGDPLCVERRGQYERGGTLRPAVVVPSLHDDSRTALSWNQRAAQRAVEGPGPVRPRLHALAREHDDLGVEQIDRPGQRSPQRVTGVGEDLLRLRVPGIGERPQLVDALVLADQADRPGIVDEGALADDRLEASTIAALAERAVLADRHVTEVPGSPGATAYEIAVGDETGADTVADRDDEDVAVLASLPEQLLGDAERVHVVLHHHGQLERALEQFAERNVMPAQLGRVDHADPSIRHGAR